MDDYLLDFDIYHVSHVTELVMYIDAKYLSRELGESRDNKGISKLPLIQLISLGKISCNRSSLEILIISLGGESDIGKKRCGNIFDLSHFRWKQGQ